MDVSKAPCIAGMSPLGFPLFIQLFEVIYIYGETEFKAQASWKEEVRLSQTHPRSTNTLLTNFPTGRREAVRLSGRDASSMLTRLQERRCCVVRRRRQDLGDVGLCKVVRLLRVTIYTRVFRGSRSISTTSSYVQRPSVAGHNDTSVATFLPSPRPSARETVNSSHIFSPFQIKLQLFNSRTYHGPGFCPNR